MVKDINTKLTENLTKEMNTQVKQEYCGHCKKRFFHLEGHHNVIHERNIVEHDRDGKRLLIHCPLCLPTAKLFINQEAFYNHLNDYDHTKSVVNRRSLASVYEYF